MHGVWRRDTWTTTKHSPFSDLCQRSIFPFDWVERRGSDMRHA
jgi:hypothetical protein